MFGTMLGFLVVFGPPHLVTDWQVRGTALALRDGTVPASDCSDRDLIEICDMTVAAPVGAAVMQRRVHYVFLSSQDGPITVQVVADPAHPGWLTTDFGLDVFWDRVASLVGATALLGGFVGGGGWAALRSYRRAQTLARAAPVGAVCVGLGKRDPWTATGDQQCDHAAGRQTTLGGPVVRRTRGRPWHGPGITLAADSRR